MEFQQPQHRYMRPPQPLPPPPSDPNHHQPPVPPPPGPTWFSGQFQYHGHSPPPPPPPNQQWAPPPPSHHPYSAAPPPYPVPPPPPYPAHHQYPPPPPRPSLPPPHSHVPQSYPPHASQDWQNSSWSQHQGWQFPAHNNGEDWAAKARAWAAAKTSTDDQYPQPQFTSVGRMEENQYSIGNPHYSDVQHLLLAASSYQQYPPAAPPYCASESASFSSGYGADGHLPFTGRNRSSIGDSSAAFSHQESSPSSLSVHQQEVPSSYSSVAGKELSADQNEQFYKSTWAFTSTPQQHGQPPPASVGRSVPMDPPHYAYGHQPAEPTTDLSDQPLNFAPQFSHDHDLHVQPNYTRESGVPAVGIDNVSALPSINAWNASAVLYPPVHPSGPQVDPSVVVPSPVPGHSGPLFGSIPGQTFQQIIPSVSAPFGVSTGNFPADAYGTSVVSDRPKKSSMPNWLREELIKNIAVIATSAPELSEEDSKSIEEEAIDKSFGKGDRTDSKSIDSSRSTEDDDDEEDAVEAARTAAINQEIKRVLTEVLLKVTDELFDEIATKVLSEDDVNVAVDNNIADSNYEVSPCTSAVPTSKASAKVMITAKINETDSDDVSGKSGMNAPGDVLGLASYASDDDEDDDIQKSGVPNSKRGIILQPSTTKTHSDDRSVVDNGGSLAETKENRTDDLTVEHHPGRMNPNGASRNHNSVASELNNNGSGREPVDSTRPSRYTTKAEFLAADDDTKDYGAEVVHGSDATLSKKNAEEKDGMRTELSVENVGTKKSSSDDSDARKDRSKHDKNDRYDGKRSYAGKDYVKEAEGDRAHVRGDDRKVKKEKTDAQNGSKDKLKEQGLKSGEKLKETDSKKISSHLDDEGIKDKRKDKRVGGKEGNDRKRDRVKDEKGERSRHRIGSDSGKHKRHRSSSVGSRGRSDKNHRVISHSNDSSEESSDDSRRKSWSRKRKLSPSPVRSRRRQDSGSPHSKRSQRRHSPYSSLETTRGKRSRSRSPARRRR